MAQRVSVYRPQLRVPEFGAPRIATPTGGRELAGAIGMGLEAFDKDMARELNDTRVQATVQVAQLKQEAAQQPWDQRKAFFDAGLAKLKPGLASGFSGPLRSRGRTEFEGEWAKISGLAAIDIADSVQKGEADHNIRTLEDGLNELSRQAAQAETEAQSEDLMTRAEEMIFTAESTTAIGEAQGGEYLRGFRRGVEKNRALALINDNPSLGLKALSDTTKFQNLREEDRLMLVGRAESKIQHQVAMSDHAAVVGERNRRILGDQIAKEGEDLLAKGQMTEDWLNQNKRVLDSTDYRLFRKAMQDGGGVDSSEAQSRILRKLYVEGDDVSGDVLTELQRGNLSVSTAKSYLDENKSSQGIKTPAQRGRAFITQYLKPSELNPSVAQAQQHAEAIAEFDRFYAEDPKQDAMDLARKVVQRNATVDLSNMKLIKPLPQYAVGGRNDLDIKATRKATRDAFLKKHGGDEAKLKADKSYLDEARRIKEWEDGLRRTESGIAAGAGAGAKPK